LANDRGDYLPSSTREASSFRPASDEERRLNELGIQLPAPPEPFGAYVEAVQTGKLLYLSQVSEKS
jgi:hypothetical protein